MHIWSLSLSLALICCTSSVQSPGLTPPTIYTFNIPTWDPYTPPSWNIDPYDVPTFKIPKFCVSSSGCRDDKTCEDGECVYSPGYNGASGETSWKSIAKPLGITLSLVIGIMVCCLYTLCKKASKPPALATRNGSLPAPPTAVAAVEANNEMQPETVATNTTVVEVEDETPLPPDYPPPYNSLAFESRQNGNEDLPEQPAPPSYDEAVINFEMII